MVKVQFFNTDAKDFFFANAGWSYNPKTETKRQGKLRTARALATAEEYAKAHGWVYEWQDDPEGCSGCDCGSNGCSCAIGSEHETLGCILKDDQGNVLRSLWSICGATDDYQRVVQAELALEAMHEEQARNRALVI